MSRPDSWSRLNDLGNHVRDTTSAGPETYLLRTGRHFLSSTILTIFARTCKKCYSIFNMNIEQLNKSQIVLLTLLVSFVTSIATGIVTVSLMDQAPPVVSQTVNRIVERTIETVAPASQTAASSGSQGTVVVKESELISQAVAKISPSIVRLHASTSTDAPFLGLGIVVKENGTIITDDSLFPGTENGGAVALSDGTRVPVTITSRHQETGIIVLQASSEGSSVSWKPAAVKETGPTLGQTVVMLSGKSVARVEEGIITAIMPVAEGSEDVVIDTNIAPETIIAGAPLFNTNGEIVGVSSGVSRTSSVKGFTASTSFPSESDSGSSEGGGATQ